MGWVRLAFSLWQGLVMLKQTSERREKYDAARAQADATGKPLLVVGGPYGDSPFRRALDMPAHGPGDVTLDLSSRAIEGIPSTTSSTSRVDTAAGSAPSSVPRRRRPA